MRKVFLTVVAGCIMAVSGMAEKIVIRIAPPVAVVEERGVAPHPGYVYQSGYHRWDGHAHVWVPGVWAAPPRPHARWVDHHWEHRGNNYVFVEGRWR